MHDVVVVGARCAGATVASLLARAGLRVLLIDRATFPSATLSTHTMHADSLAVLADLGLLARIDALGAPAVRHVVCDYGAFQIAGQLPPYRGIDRGYCIPRLSLDDALVRHAAACGVEVAEGVAVTEVEASGHRAVGVRGQRGERAVRIAARLVVGADGRTSAVARSVRSQKTVSQHSGWALWYGYYGGVPLRRDPAYELYFHGRSMFFVFPTTGGLHILGGEFNTDEHPQLRVKDEPRFLYALRGCASLRPRLDAARLADGLYGLYRIESFMREPGGSGWVLVGDASFFKDPCTGQGMFDAFRGAQLLSEQLARGWDDGDLDGALRRYAHARDAEFGEMFRYTCRAALSLPLSPERLHVLRRVSETPELTTLYLGIHNHTVRPSELFSKLRMRTLLAEA